MPGRRRLIIQTTSLKAHILLVSEGNKKRRPSLKKAKFNDARANNTSNRISIFEEELAWTPNPEIMQSSEVITSVPRKTKTQHDLLDEWFEKRAAYLAVLLEHEALPLGTRRCECNSGYMAFYVCTSCHGHTSHCQICILAMHRRNPLHRIKKWTNNFLEDASLSQLGLITYLGHNGAICPISTNPLSITVIHIDGSHKISVSFCQCHSATSPDLQLLESKLFPASTYSPRTVFTFEVLKAFSHLSFEGKISAYTYVQSLYRLTGSEILSEIPDRVREFRRVSREWNFLQTKKHSGTYGPMSSAPPTTLMCPTCPRPGINTPENWYELLPLEKHWTMRRFIHFDANFRLVLSKKENRSTADRTLWSDGGFFADPQTYKEYLASVNQEHHEKSDCVNHRAATLASRSRFSRLEITGIAGAVCRHECAIPNGFVNLHKGERYVNSDFAISNILYGMSKIKEVILSYDIACQYQRNFHTRFANSPFLHRPDISLIFLIPKFHLPAHKIDCHYQYSFNYERNVGRTDGEAIERFWSTHNFLSGSTMRMTPGSRADTLNFHFNDWNWKKTCKMGKTLINRLVNAQDMENRHALLLEEIEESLDPAKVADWSAQSDEYIFQHGVRPIYQVASDKSPTKAQILQRLTEIGSGAANEDQVGLEGHERPAAVFWVDDGLRIQESQHRLRILARKINDNSPLQLQVELNRKRTLLLEQIATWKARSPAAIEEDDFGDNESVLPEALKLNLPSEFPLDDQIPYLREIEKQLCEAQAFDYLKALRKCLAERTALLRTRDRRHRGQDERLRSTAVISRMENEISFIADRYRTVYTAISTLGGNNPQLRKLERADVSAANVFRFTDVLGRGKNTEISWIWRMEGVGVEAQDDNWLDEVLRVQYLEAKVNHDRWVEEQELLRAEISFTIGTFEYMERYWSSMAALNLSPGSIAHGYRMASFYNAMIGQLHQYR